MCVNCVSQLSKTLPVERNRYQEFMRGQDILHFSSEQIREQGYFPCAFHLESESDSLTLIQRNKSCPCYSLPGITVPVCICSKEKDILSPHKFLVPVPFNPYT